MAQSIEEREVWQQGTSVPRLLEQTRLLADELAARPNLGLDKAPRRELDRLAEIGLLMAPFPTSCGGLGLGIAARTQLPLLRLLAMVGGADLALGRILEGHVNAVLLVHRFGTPQQVQRLANDCRAGMVCGVWNTGGQDLLRLRPSGTAFRLEGIKTFATGAAFIKRPIVTVELESGGWQMTLPRMEKLNPTLDRSFWHPLGMESSESYQVDFTGDIVERGDFIGSPGDFYRDPIFRGGAIRFAAVQAGAILRLHAMFTGWLKERGRDADPYQIARLGEIAIHAQESALWIEKAAAVAEQNFYGTEKQHAEQMIECANMMRLAIERKAVRSMELIVSGVGAHGLLQPHRFERVLRDLTMYLRQPAPDQALAAVGRAAIDKANRRSTGVESGFWSGESPLESLPAHYFQRIYGHKADPWDFETSPYERDKYRLTLESLPRQTYRSALEVGCSIGVLTACLALRCESLLGLDVSEQALDQARSRNADLSQVRFDCMQVPDQMPDGSFDLIVVSEVAYYWSAADLERAVEGLAACHQAGGHLVLVHLTEHVPDYPLTGDQVHTFWLARPEWKSIHSARYPRYRIDVMERLEASSASSASSASPQDVQLPG